MDPQTNILHNPAAAEYEMDADYQFTCEPPGETPPEICPAAAGSAQSFLIIFNHFSLGAAVGRRPGVHNHL